MKKAILFLTFLSPRDFPDGVVPRHAFWIGLASGLFACWITLRVLFLQLHGVFQSPYFGPMSLVEESAYTYTSATNYLTYGYLHSGLLQDFSNSADPSDHPYVYNHMPPGPDLVFAFLLQVTGQNFHVARAVLALAGIAGMWWFARFVQIILGRAGFYGGGFVFLFINPWFVAQFYERLIYNLAPLLIFAPLVLFHAFHQTRRLGFLIAAVTIAFVSALYVEYSTLAAVVFAWIMIYLTGLLPLSRRQILMFLGALFSGIFLHLLQNLLFLGPELFFQELSMTLGNRTVGVPGQQDLKAFYREHAIVHHGSHAIKIGTLLGVIAENLCFPYANKLIWITLFADVLALFFLVPRFFVHKNRVTSAELAPLGFLARLLVSLTVIILIPIILFPAFAQEVNLRGSGINYFFLAIGQYSCLAFALQQIVRRAPFRIHFGAQHPLFFQITRSAQVRESLALAPRFALRNFFSLAALSLLVVVWAFAIGMVFRFGKEIFSNRRVELHGVAVHYEKNPFACLAELEKFGGEPYVTNINTPTVGFFTKSAGYGVCGPDTVNESGDIDLTKCKVAFMRHDYLPRYFFFFSAKELFPGFADDMPDSTILAQDRGGDHLVKRLLDRLEANYEKVYQNSLFHVFDLRKKKYDPGLYEQCESDISENRQSMKVPLPMPENTTDKAAEARHAEEIAELQRVITGQAIEIQRLKDLLKKR